MNIEFIEKIEQSSGVWTLIFKPKSKIRYIPGQFVELTLKHSNPDERGIKRWFTLSSDSLDEQLSITTRKSKPSSSFKKALFNLKPGDLIECSSPMGDFVLPKDSNTPLIFIAIGIGITPFISMLSYLAKRHINRDIQLMHSVRNISDYPFKTELGSYNLAKDIVTDKYITVDSLRSQLDITNNSQIYMAGPEVVVEKLTNKLIASGIDKRQVVTDYFPGY